MKRDLLSLEDLTNDELLYLLKLSANLKQNKNDRRKLLDGKTVGLLFQKPSNRTRVSFEVGVWQLGGNCLYLSPQEIQLGARESTADVARTLSRFIDGIVARTNLHDDIIELSHQATIPVINGLSDLHHPCQAIADLLSLHEKFGGFNGITLAYVGDGNNVCHSLLLGCAKVGLNINIATPKGYEPLPEIFKLAQKLAQETRTRIQFGHQAAEAIKGVQAIYADTWVSMGQEIETKKRLKDFKGFQVNDKLAQLADKNYVFMHCLPAHRGQEVTQEIIDGKHSIIFDQAENRLHVQKAILIFLLG